MIAITSAARSAVSSSREVFAAAISVLLLGACGTAETTTVSLQLASVGGAGLRVLRTEPGALSLEEGLHRRGRRSRNER